MRLLHTSTLTLHEFFGDEIPSYAILSHTWGDEEVTLQDLEKGQSKSRAGYAKITGCCALALSNGWEWLWIDTCCIDKTSSAELSESINSMYRWYRDSGVCYAYLTDCFLRWGNISDVFCKCRWFTRGWTLQELLAPSTVIFYDRDWCEIGTRSSLTPQISIVTGISSQDMADPQSASIAAKMSWASRRQTSRVEDMAYSLLGIFDLTMPLLYGEGHNAFKRLQYELIGVRSDDESIFAWKHDDPRPSGMLAQSPAAFADSGDIVTFVNLDALTRPPRVTGKLLVMNGISPIRGPTEDVKTSLIILNCARQASIREPLGIRLVPGVQGNYMRAEPGTLLECESPRNTKQPTRPGFYNNWLEIWLDQPYAKVSKFISHHFHVHLPLLKQGFRLSDEFLSDYSHLWWYNGCWQATFSSTRDVGVMMFIGDRTGAKFLLVLAVRDNLPSVDVVVPYDTQTPSLEEIATRYRDVHYGNIRGVDELFRPLQGKNHVLVTLRKKFLRGKRVNVVDVSIRQERTTSRVAITRGEKDCNPQNSGRLSRL